VSWTYGYTPDQWTAAGVWAQVAVAILTFGVAAFAAVYAKRQVGEAYRLRLEQTQPYVTASLEPTAGQIAELVIRNEGKTPAYNVRFRFSPEYRPAHTDLLYDFTRSKLWREGLPSMVPGQSIHVLIDTFPARYKACDLPRSYEVTVEFEDHDGKPFRPLRYVADFEAFFGYNNVNLKTIHDVAKQLRKLDAIAAQLCKIRADLTPTADEAPAARDPFRPQPLRRQPGRRRAQVEQPRMAGTRRRPPRRGAPREADTGLVVSLPMEPLSSTRPENHA